MFKVKFFKESNGTDRLAEYLDELAIKSLTSKSDRIKLKKIIQYIELLKKYGTKLGEPYVKHIDDDVWELRPLADRIFFFYWKDRYFIMLHHFIKKTNKTPQREIDHAKRNKNEFLERGYIDEE